MAWMEVRQAAELWQVPERKVTALCREGRIPGAKKSGKLWQIPEGSLRPLDARTREYAASRKEAETSCAADAGNRAVMGFRDTYHKEPETTAFTPYRICPIGAHSDHNLGKVTGMTIDKGIAIACGPKQNGVIEIRSLQFPKRAQWHVNSTPPEKENDWADHLRGATIALARRFPLHVGLCAVLDGELPIGGLSSSAAVIISFLSALCRLNGIQLSPEELIQISLEAENRYVGVSCGRLDQSCEVYCRKDKLLYLDTLDGSFELIPRSPQMKPVEIAVLFSGRERSLAGTQFNMRVDEARAAAYSLKAFSGIPYGKIEETNLREVPEEIFRQYRDRLPESFARRAEHWYGEFHRVEQGAEAWRRGDLESFGQLCFQSGLSSIENWQTGSPELIRLYEIMTQTDGIYGGRFSGAGFKGCCVALVDPAKREQVLARVERAYLESFPGLRGRYSAHICHMGDGVRL